MHVRLESSRTRWVPRHASSAQQGPSKRLKAKPAVPLADLGFSSPKAAQPVVRSPAPLVRMLPHPALQPVWSVHLEPLCSSAQGTLATARAREITSSTCLRLQTVMVQVPRYLVAFTAMSTWKIAQVAMGLPSRRKATMCWRMAASRINAPQWMPVQGASWEYVQKEAWDPAVPHARISSTGMVKSAASALAPTRFSLFCCHSASSPCSLLHTSLAMTRSHTPSPTSQSLSCWQALHSAYSSSLVLSPRWTSPGRSQSIRFSSYPCCFQLSSRMCM
mmetsp:Transcript_2405/g.5121  ORF Transcript_2405/g.5121 Transcript_2405/m.5121 type:complete len:276 (-) Transcript_2405:2751-3578(-)